MTFKKTLRVLITSLLVALSVNIYAGDIVVGGRSCVLIVSSAGKSTIRVSLIPSNISIPFNPVIGQKHTGDILKISNLEARVEKKFSSLIVRIDPSPLRITVKGEDGSLIQELVFRDDGTLKFRLDNMPVLGMGEGGPRVSRDWRNLSIEFDRKGRLHKMEPRWQGNSYGSRNPVPLLIGTGGWGLFVADPWVQVDMTKDESGIFIPRESLGLDTYVQGQGDQQSNSGKGMPPSGSYVPGLYDLFIFDTSNPLNFFGDISKITGKSVMPPLWALGYMQSHRTLEDDEQMVSIVKAFREKKIPLDAVIYLGTGFCPRGWNTKQPSFDFNPEVFKSSPEDVISELHNLNVKVVLHIVPWDRDRLPTLKGNIPASGSEVVDSSHILNYWVQHNELVKSGVDAWWPDEGDWFNLWERVKRHQLYYQGPLQSIPNVRPWSLHRNGYIGISKWGGWVWSGDTESSWKTLEGQIAVGINHSLSLSPFWGSDIGGFYPSEELDGELYARWFQFGAFCPSFRSHGRTWWTRLPWGWGLSEMGPLENRTNPMESELNNPEIENICREYANLRYRLLSYNYDLTWEAREKGLPIMRAMWIHYPEDKFAASLGDQYLWGRSFLVAPVYKKGVESRSVYLPKGKWYDWWTGEEYTGGKIVKKSVDLSIMPLFVKAGSIIPIDPLRQYSAQHSNEALEIRVYTGENTCYELFQDDGISLDYLDGNGFNLTSFSWDDEEESLTIQCVGAEVSKCKKQKFRVVIYPGNKYKNVIFKGREKTIKF